VIVALGNLRGSLSHNLGLARPSSRDSQRGIAFSTVYTIGVILAVGASLLLGRHSGGSVVALALGLFAALLTAVTLIILLTLDVDSSWPSLQDILDEAYLTRWFLLAMVAISLAAFVDDTKEEWLTTLAIMLSLLSGLLGSLSLFHLLRISTGDGRRRFLGQLLSSRVAYADASLPAKGHKADVADSPDLAAFIARFQKAVDARDVAALRERVEELAIAGTRATPTNARTVLALDLRVLRDLGRAVLLGRLDSPDIGATLLPRLGELTVDHAARIALPETRLGPSSDDGAQIACAAYLGQAARMLAWIGGAGYSSAVEQRHASPALCAMAAGAVVAREHILEAVDPELAPGSPTAMYLPEGLSDPTAALVWWWCFCDLNGAHDGLAFYAAIWMLTGEKFYGSFGWGNRFLLSELDERLSSASGSALSERRVRSSGVIAELGGLRRVALELFATSMAGWRDRRDAIPGGLEQNWTYWEDPRRLARRARLFLPRSGEPWLKSADDALEMAAFLLSRGHVHDGLAALVSRNFAPLPIVSMPPVLETQRRPGAAVLALSAHLAPREERDSPAELEQFLKRLPQPLLAGALSLAQAILHIADAPARSREPVQALVELLGFLHHDQQDAQQT
jgi:hypothetical protein